jgi:hypothetical protein
MKTTIITFIIFLIGCNLYAQENIKISPDENIKISPDDNIKISPDDNQEIKTIFKKEKKDGFYGAFSAGYSSIDNKDGLTFSARGCWIMDHCFSVGIGGTGFINELDQIGFRFNSETNNDLKLAGGYGGIILEPIIMPLKPVHLSFPILLGAGATSSFKNYDYFSTDYVEDFFWVIEPQAELEVNFTRWLRFALYAGYRYTSQLNITDISKNALHGYSAGITVKMGMF